jgi:UDP-3-O-[3-hydroxymyristoyl] glucosamine N-acyltransferase
MATTLAELADLARGRLVGDGQTRIDCVATLAEAGEGALTMIDRAALVGQLHEIAAAAAVVPADVDLQQLSLPAILVDDVHEAFTAIALHFRPPQPAQRIGISSAAHVSPTAQIAADVDIHPGAVIDDDVHLGRGATIHSGVRILRGCRIAEDVAIMPNCVLYEDTRVGPRTLIHAGVVLGAYGFGYKQKAGAHHRTSQLGHVRIGADVEIGANTTIDRGTYGATTIGDGTKIDNLVMIAHNCRIGRHNLICSQVGIAGSTTTGDWVVMAGQVGVRDHVHIGQGAVLGAMAGISNDVPDGMRMIGIPATPEREQKLKQAALTKLPEMRKQLKALERDVARLTAMIQRHDDSAAA